jgi:hypothetical protein
VRSSDDGVGRAAIPNNEGKGIRLKKKEKRIRKGGEEKRELGTLAKVGVLYPEPASNTRLIAGLAVEGELVRGTAS